MNPNNPYASPQSRASQSPSADTSLKTLSATRCVVFSMLSGCVWAVLGYLLASQVMGVIIWGAVAASPFIGLAVGLLYRPVYHKSVGVRVGASLATLYLAVVLFGFAAGIYDACRPIPNRLLGEVVLQAIIGSLWGVTFTGFFVVLWPLSFFNHWLVGRLSGCVTISPSASTT